MSRNVTGDEFQKLVEKVESLENELEEEREKRRQAEQRVDELEDDVDDHDDRLDDAESRLDAVGTGIEAIHDELAVLEGRLEGDLAEDVEQNAAPDVPRETPLEDVVALPEDLADRELDKRSKRARFIAMDPRDYGDKCFSGRIMTAGRIGRTLAAGLDVDPHPETVRRVMERLDALGKDTTTLRKKNGEKRINIDEDAVDRLERHAEMGHGDHDVVSPAEG
jgi:DNA repair exonuclease SbcCD ATPase subunit